MPKTWAEFEYQTRLDEWISCHAATPIDWPTLLESVPSVYPAVVRESAVRQGLWKNVRHSTESLESSTGSIALEQWLQRALPTPHPLDSSWWFTNRTLDELTHWVEQLSSPGDAVALLGTPTLFHYLRRVHCDRNIVLVDRAACLSESSSSHIIQSDLLQSHVRFATAAAVVLVDPPWYASEMRAFLWNARLNSTRGTKILLSTPPVGTRPEIDHEWKELAVWCKDVGFRILERKTLALRYLSPPFETNALRADGISDNPLDWRRGDLVFFECVGDQPPYSIAPDRKPNQTWIDFLIGRVRVKIRSAPAKDKIAALLYEIVPNDVLPSVSRRDQRLDEVALWTSGNRVFGCHDAPELCNIVKAMTGKKSSVSMLVSELGRTQGRERAARAAATIARLRKVFETEEMELEEWNRKLNANLVQLAS